MAFKFRWLRERKSFGLPLEIVVMESNCAHQAVEQHWKDNFIELAL